MYPVEYRKATINVLRYTQCIRKAAKIMNISPSTLWRWKHLGIIPKTWPKRNTNKDLLQSFIHNSLVSKSFITQKEIQRDISLKFGLNVSCQCIGNIIKHLGFSRKRLKKRASYPTIQQLTIFKTNIQSNTKRFVAIDESGFGSLTIPIYGYSKYGQRAFLNKKIKMTKRVSIIVALDNLGNRYYEIVHGTTNANRFNLFLNNLPWTSSEVCLLMDNARIHKTSEVRSTLANFGNVIYTSPYSPDLNPVETIFSIVKSAYRKVIFDTIDRVEIIKTLFDNVSKETISKAFERSLFGKNIVQTMNV